MKSLPRLDAALIALVATMLIAIGVIAYAVLVLRPGDSTAPLVLATTTPSGPTAVPWLDSTPGPSPTISPSPTPDPADLAVKACRAEDLIVGLDGSDGGNAGYGLYFSFANVSNEVCRLQGPPAAAVLDNDGVELQTVGKNGASCSSCPPFLLPPTSPRPSPAFGKLSAKPGYVRLGLFWASVMFRPTPSLPRCDARGSSVRFELPDSGGNLLIEPPKNDGGFLDGCEAPGVSQFYLIPARQDPPPRPLEARIIAPASVEAGSDLDYFLYLTNVSDTPFVFGGVCPNYEEELGTKDYRETHALNCDHENPLAPGKTAIFAMRMSVPATLRNFPALPDSYQTTGYITDDLRWTILSLVGAKSYIRVHDLNPSPFP